MWVYYLLLYWRNTVSYLGDTVFTINFGRHLEENSTYYTLKGGGSPFSMSESCMCRQLLTIPWGGRNGVGWGTLLTNWKMPPTRDECRKRILPRLHIEGQGWRSIVGSSMWLPGVWLGYSMWSVVCFRPKDREGGGGWCEIQIGSWRPLDRDEMVEWRGVEEPPLSLGRGELPFLCLGGDECSGFFWTEGALLPRRRKKTNETFYLTEFE